MSLPPAITLDRVSIHHLSRVQHLAVRPDQEQFSGTVAEAFEAAEPRVDFHAILKLGQVVGFFKLDREYFRKFNFARPSELGLRGFLVDQRVEVAKKKEKQLVQEGW